jgi:hypothetical protein
LRGARGPRLEGHRVVWSLGFHRYLPPITRLSS